MPAVTSKINPTVGSKLNEVKGLLLRSGIDRPDIAAAILVASAMKCPRLELSVDFNEQLSPAQNEKINEGISRLEKHEPIQYVLGATDFMGRVFKCDPRALIPRPETEELVDLMLNCEPFRQIENPSVIDIGTGNGCIVVTLALHKKKGKYLAIDISARAIELAKENALLHNVLDSITFIVADFMGEEIPSGIRNFNIADFTTRKIPEGIDAVVANPPYVRTADYQRLAKHIRCWEPRRALDGGEDGLEIIRPLVKKAFEILKPDRFLFLEIGFDQWKKVRQLLAQTGFKSGLVRRDLSGRNRMVMAVK